MSTRSTIASTDTLHLFDDLMDGADADVVHLQGEVAWASVSTGGSVHLVLPRSEWQELVAAYMAQTIEGEKRRKERLRVADECEGHEWVKNFVGNLRCRVTSGPRPATPKPGWRSPIPRASGCRSAWPSSRRAGWMVTTSSRRSASCARCGSGSAQ